jgi:hypothetical protein
MEFHSPQASQRPDHFVVTFPHAEQEYDALDFAIAHLLPDGGERDKSEAGIAEIIRDSRTQKLNK